MNLSAISVNVRILVGGKRVPMWRVRALGFCARLLGVPVDTAAEITTAGSGAEAAR